MSDIVTCHYLGGELLLQTNIPPEVERKPAMIHLVYGSAFGLLLISLLGALSQVGSALDEADLDRLFIWSCVATAITGLAMVLW